MSNNSLLVLPLDTPEQCQRLKNSLLSIVDTYAARTIQIRPTPAPGQSATFSFPPIETSLKPAVSTQVDVLSHNTPNPPTPISPANHSIERVSAGLPQSPASDPSKVDKPICFAKVKSKWDELYIFNVQDKLKSVGKRSRLAQVMNRQSLHFSHRPDFEDHSKYPLSADQKAAAGLVSRTLFCACANCEKGTAPVRAECERYRGNNGAIVLGDVGGGEHRVCGFWHGVPKNKASDDEGRYSYDSPTALRTAEAISADAGKRKVSASVADTESVIVTPNKRKRKRGLNDLRPYEDAADDEDDEDYVPDSPNTRRGGIGGELAVASPTIHRQYATESLTSGARCKQCVKDKKKCEPKGYYTDTDRWKRCEKQTRICERPPKIRSNTPATTDADTPAPAPRVIVSSTPVLTPKATDKLRLESEFEPAFNHVLQLRLPSGDPLAKQKNSPVLNLSKSLEAAALETDDWLFGKVWRSIDVQLRERSLQCLPARRQSLVVRLSVGLEGG